MNEPKSDRVPRHRVLTLLAFALWGMAAVNLARAWQASQNVNLLTGWQPSLSPYLVLVISLLWAAPFAAAGWGIWRRHDRARRLVNWLLPLYGLYSTAFTLLFSRTPYSRGRWLPVVLGWALATILVRWLLARPRVKSQFTRTS